MGMSVTQIDASFALAEDLEQCRAGFGALLARADLPPAAATELRRRYAEPHRAYHDAAHVGLLWLRHLLHGGDPADRDLALAILFHDVVYDPKAKDNEARSAELLAALVRLGHNHVITSADESGYAWLGRTPGDCGFQLRLPVAALVVDDPEARRRAGADFAASVPDDAREGTRRNMLSQAVLDAEHYPWITVTAERLEGSWEHLSATATVEIRDSRSIVALPMEILREDDKLSAHGTISLRQSELGMTPFSVAGGAIQVADALEIEFTIVATER